MTAKDQLSELRMDLHDRSLHLNQDQELNEVRATHQSMTANMKELQNENGHLEEEACGLYDKVNSNNCGTCITNALFAITFPKLMWIFCLSG